MSVLFNCQKISKSFGSRQLFKGLTLSIDEGEKVGVVGPNGAGKSTLLKILAAVEDIDDGDLALKKGLSITYLPQNDVFEEETAFEVVSKALESQHLEEHEARTRVQKFLTQFGFSDCDVRVSTLSGGWCKRLALARAFVVEPDLLLLDEPTNHLDLHGVIWLEKLLSDARFSFVLVSHDRHFLENVTTRIVEVNPVYEDGCLSVKGAYSDFLVSRQEYLVAQSHLEQALASKVRREVAWLQRGARARQTKSSARIKEAGVLMESLDEVRSRNNLTAKIDLEFDATGRKTKELLAAKGLEKSLGGKVLFSKLDVVLRPGTRLGLVGANGTGKSTLLRILSGALEPCKGTIKRAQDLKIVWFDQNRQQLDQSQTLWKALCPDGDSVTYRDRSLHVSTWARRFLFKTDQLHMPVSYLSGGEQARILIANLMLRPADVLILDEPTNDLDIPSLEVLEDSLKEFPGAIVLVTHDRFMIHEVTNTVLCLDEAAKCRYFADYSQLEGFLSESQTGAKAAPSKKDAVVRSSPEQTAREPEQAAVKRGRGLSTSEKKELTEIAHVIEKAESEAAAIQDMMADASVASDHQKLCDLQLQLEAANDRVQNLYLRWEDLESRSSS